MDLKEHLNLAALERLADHLAATGPFDRAAFIAQASHNLDALALRQRVIQASDAARAHLPNAWPDALDRIVCAAPPQPGLGSFWLWPLLQMVEDHGLSHPSLSLDALGTLTSRFSAEFAIRPYLEQHPELSFAWLRARIAHPDPHVRRLISEGTRPRLPWGRRLRALQADPSPSLPLLEALRDDPEDYVRRSVANHLNDLSKDHPSLVAELCERWMHNAPEPRERLIRHALRTLVKAGDPKALAILGFDVDAPVSATLTASPDPVTIGGSLTLHATLHGQASRVALDLLVNRPTARGRSDKVWKGGIVAVEGHTTWSKTLHLRDVSVRTWHPGELQITLIANGAEAARVAVTLTRS